MTTSLIVPCLVGDTCPHQGRHALATVHCSVSTCAAIGSNFVLNGCTKPCKRNWVHQLVKAPQLKASRRQGQSANVQRSEMLGRIHVTSSNPKLRKGSERAPGPSDPPGGDPACATVPATALREHDSAKVAGREANESRAFTTSFSKEVRWSRR